MESHSSLKVLLVAEGSGGHLIPAMQVARALAQIGARVKLWYMQRRRTSPLAHALLQGLADPSIDVETMPIEPTSNLMRRLWYCGRLWSQSQRCFETFSPDVVVGFGGWVSAPVMLAARQRSVGCVLHEQNVQLGRANRWLAPWVDQVAISFQQTKESLDGTPAVLTGLPIRSAIGSISRSEAARRFGLEAERPTILVVGGSQGARVINRLVTRAIAGTSPEERRRWQWLHVTGLEEDAAVRAAYQSQGIDACVAAYVPEMEAAYAQADVVITRTGASTVAELAQCGKPAILIPYPHARAHQRANARVIESVGGGLVLEEAEATPERLLELVRRLLRDGPLREAMASRIKTLAIPDAAQRLTDVITRVRADHHDR